MPTGGNFGIYSFTEGSAATIRLPDLHLTSVANRTVTSCRQVLPGEVQRPRQVLLPGDHQRRADDGAAAGPGAERLAQRHRPRHGDEYVHTQPPRHSRCSLTSSTQSHAAE